MSFLGHDLGHPEVASLVEAETNIRGPLIIELLSSIPHDLFACFSIRKQKREGYVENIMGVYVKIARDKPTAAQATL